MEKYFFIFEDGEPKISDKVTQDDMNSSDDGFLEIIRVSDQKRYMEGDWIEMEKWEN